MSAAGPDEAGAQNADRLPRARLPVPGRFVPIPVERLGLPIRPIDVSRRRWASSRSQSTIADPERPSAASTLAGPTISASKVAFSRSRCSDQPDCAREPAVSILARLSMTLSA
jgi:hypothetical protein